MNAVDQVRAVALLLPETEEREVDGDVGFFVDGKPFATVSAAVPTVVRVREAAGEASIMLNDDVDWALVEDRVARSWEMTAPRRLLEAGGR
ncbi:MmcQ/YjbR family DNA-binding protein [Sphingomonas sp. 8AM]|uniref:MmcQ/YjbR family DNA-binding protein n=1 Tax=Sphingomonas sp. 8AM TaxID=2653170 RepID=UPI0012F142F8|nr:MmcQ/YjbR family DNA-binding protein [Sphingomonas sp. 8AM]VXC55647.1 conserved hypothetical protein [Sphingomonas sp. 8AM]